MANGNLAYKLHCDSEKYFEQEDRSVVKNHAGLTNLLKVHGLDYEVAMRKLKHPMTGEPIPFYASLRLDTGAVLGAGLTERYQPIQNRDGFALIADLAQERPDGVMFARGMTFDAGRVAVAQIDLGEMQIGEGRGGFKDRVRNRITWTNAHDGSGAAQVFVTPTRIVCANTLTAAMQLVKRDEDGQIIKKSRGWSDGAGKFTIRHTKNAQNRLDEARKILKVIDGSLVRTEKTFQALAYTKVTNAHIKEALERLFSTEDKTAERGGKTRIEAVEAIQHYIKSADGGRIDPESGWNFYNSINHYMVHNSPVRIHGEDKGLTAQNQARQQSTLSGAIYNKNSKALQTVVEVLEIEDDIERMLKQVETSQVAQLATYATQPLSIFDLEVGVG